MGGSQTYEITQANLDKFGSIASFSAPFGYPDVATGFGGLLAKPDDFAKQVKVLFVSLGSTESDSDGPGVSPGPGGGGREACVLRIARNGARLADGGGIVCTTSPLIFQD